MMETIAEAKPALTEQKTKPSDFVIDFGSGKSGFSFNVYDRDDLTQQIGKGGPLPTKEAALEAAYAVRDREIEARRAHPKIEAEVVVAQFERRFSSRAATRSQLNQETLVGP